MQRTLITVGLLLCALGITVAVVLNDPGASRPAPPPAPSPTQPSPEDPAPKPPSVAPAVPVEAIEGLKAVAAPEAQEVPELGGKDLDDPDYFLFARFSPWGGGIKEVRLLHHRTQVAETQTYTAQQQLAKWQNDPATKFPQYRYSMAASAITVNGKRVDLAPERWRVVGAGSNEAVFEIDLADGQDQPVLRIRRTWRLSRRSHDLRLRQTFENLGNRPLELIFSQFGPSELPSDGGYIGDQRKVEIGYLEKRGRGADAYHILSTADFSLPRGKVIGDAYYDTLWPAQEPEPDRHIAWLAMSNRYFAAALFTALEPGQTRPRRLEDQFERVRRLRWKTGDDYEEQSTLALVLDSVPLRLEPAGGERASAQLGIDMFIGPKDPALLDNAEQYPVYATYKLEQLIVYKLGMCAMCTFDWLSDLLMGFFRLIHSLFADWGLAIILLVAVVRTLLHPLTKRSQVNMMKMSKQMQTLQPEIARLKSKYGDNQQKLNQEMMSLYRERGVNPAAMGLGCLPMFLQMPIWFALYAMLYFAVELRHEPAFWGVFQKISGGDWLFMADLSSTDNFLRFGTPIDLGLFQLRSLNVLPILMGLVFFLQQKYASPTGDAVSEQARQQQKMMKWMIMLFPIFLYAAPCGLNLYILTSTATGIVESRRVRAHLKELEEQGRLFEKKPRKEGGFLDRLARAAEARQQQMVEQQKQGGRSSGGRSRKKGGGKSR